MICLIIFAFFCFSWISESAIDCNLHFYLKFHLSYYKLPLSLSPLKQFVGNRVINDSKSKYILKAAYKNSPVSLCLWSSGNFKTVFHRRLLFIGEYEQYLFIEIIEHTLWLFPLIFRISWHLLAYSQKQTDNKEVVLISTVNSRLLVSFPCSGWSKAICFTVINCKSFLLNRQV